jgi:hypothetical protein
LLTWLTSVTDDLEIKTEGQTLVKLKPRRGPTPFSRRASRWQWVKGELRMIYLIYILCAEGAITDHLFLTIAHLEPNQGSEPAGFDIDGKAVDVDAGSDYDSYKTFEIEFENSPSMSSRFSLFLNHLTFLRNIFRLTSAQARTTLCASGTK